MQPTPPDSQPRKWNELMVSSFLGAIVGCFLALIPLSYVWYFPSDVPPPYLLVLLVFGVLGGIVGLFSNPKQIGHFFDSIPWF